ncbi:hypothetical protein GO013_15610 [Pseudodesulfovibrio sp. JC047]|uniref:hypothetical protein n=1 Tax=Pseudodesulfovibrio sp. JC047 TaxID=2683199 RepID=UPI0013D27404|nr:hypothetical protein [Pseudodesulfovibrio sp. JC047]NDV20837.1 hypothetical protein [Pseudodesulfovibrio sp. JC047]
MPRNSMEIIAFISAAIKIGYSFADITKRLTADGYEVPSLEEYEARTKELRNLPDLAEDSE